MPVPSVPSAQTTHSSILQTQNKMSRCLKDGSALNSSLVHAALCIVFPSDVLFPNDLFYFVIPLGEQKEQ